MQSYNYADTRILIPADGSDSGEGRGAARTS
jgi:hypothetical protein